MSTPLPDPGAVPPDPAGSSRQPHRASSPARRMLPLYRVVLLNSNADLMFIVRTVMELTRLCREEATHKMWQAHHLGRSILLVTHRERAELYAEQFAGRGLLVAIEPA